MRTNKILLRIRRLIYGARLRRFNWETPKFPNGYHGEINDAWLASQRGAGA